MKKAIFLILIILSFFPIFSVNWEDDIQVKVTEYIPWAGCVCNQSSIATKSCIQYTCTIKPWFTTIQEMIWKIIKWIAAIATLSWVLFIVINWMRLSMWGMDSGAKEDAKKFISKTIIWLILLLLSWVILSVIAPWIYI